MGEGGEKAYYRWYIVAVRAILAHFTMSATLETINLSHHPASLPIHVALYRDVQNAAFLRQQLITGKADFEYAFIDASMVGHRRLRLDS